MYPRSLFFRFSPETAHKLALAGASLLAPFRSCAPLSGRKVKVLGLEFANPVGLAAGMDKNADHVDGMGALGFGFVEVGTVTPRPQPGNPQPRLFRIPEAEAIVNRMGFNNLGVDHLVASLAKRRYSGILGINIGKNFDTPLERAVDDYLFCLERVYPLADYIVVNISSPNTKNLRELQRQDALDALLTPLKERQAQLAAQHGKAVPLLVKIAPDLDDEAVEAMAEVFRATGVEGVIATNTTIDRAAVAGLPHAEEAGGLSGAPVKLPALKILKTLRRALGPDMPIIGVGGIMSGDDARERLAAGADLVQLYSGLIYRGPGLVAEAVRATAS